MANIMEKTATKIKRARQASGMTQADAAQAAGVPLSSFQSYEQGKVTPPYGRVEAILAALSSALPEQDCSEEGVFHLILAMNDQPFYRFRCVGEALGDVEFNIDLNANLLKAPRDP